MSVTAGVVAVQGDIRAHEAAFERLGAAVDRDIEVRPIRTSGVLPSCDLVAIPGGESTTISKLLNTQGIAPELREHVEVGKPVLATCAGLIVVSSDPADARIEPLGLLDVQIDRNAFGRQRESFEASIEIDGLDTPFPGVFIRAPIVSDARDTTVLSELNDRVIAVKSGPVVGTSFHPELAGDPRLHQLAFSDAL